jgi:hypothetical protein
LITRQKFRYLVVLNDEVLLRVGIKAIPFIKALSQGMAD